MIFECSNKHVHEGKTYSSPLIHELKRMYQNKLFFTKGGLAFLYLKSTK